jgi:hypothetical protein
MEGEVEGVHEGGGRHGLSHSGVCSRGESGDDCASAAHSGTTWIVGGEVAPVVIDQNERLERRGRNGGGMVDGGWHDEAWLQCLNHIWHKAVPQLYRKVSSERAYGTVAIL